MAQRFYRDKDGIIRPITPRGASMRVHQASYPRSTLREKHYSSVRPDPPRDPPTSQNPEGGYQGWSNWDTWETKLLIDNDQALYNQKISAEKNFLRKEKAGTFDREAARYYVQEYMVKAARKQDEGIDPKKVNLGEIVDSMMAEARENERYETEHPKMIDEPADRSSANYYKNARAMADHGYVETPDSIQGGKSHYQLKNGKTFTGKSGLSKSEVENAIRLEEKYA